ncbi:MAG: DUF2786 domain-containing protein [Nannocystaceae bacterium]
MSTPPPSAAELSAELEAKLLQRLAFEWESINYTHFRDALARPVFQLSETRARLGQWHGELRCLEISRPLVLERPWVEVVEVLKHEVAHQFICERYGLEEDPHGPAFRKVCEHLGIDGRATGTPTAAPEPDDRAERIVARIHKLLALAQSPNQHEAETAAMTARKLMLKFNVELDAVDRAAPRGSRRRAYGYRHLGRPSGRILEHQRRLASILIHYFFVEGLWIPVYRPREGKRGSVLEICGLEANLAMAEHVHAFLTGTAERLWDDYRQATSRSTRGDRQAFLAGVMRGFESKLEAQSERFAEEGLVWVPNADLAEYFRRRYPKTRTVRRGGAQRNRAFAEGSRAGRAIVLSTPVTTASEGGGRPKALRAKT